MIYMANERYNSIKLINDDMRNMMSQICLENALSSEHMKDLTHESVVLEERQLVSLIVSLYFLIKVLNLLLSRYFYC